MRDRTKFIALVGLCGLAMLGAPAHAADKTADNPNGCQIIERHADNQNQPGSGSVSSGITAGGGRVSGSASAGGGSVTVHSGNGSGGSAVAMSGSSGDGASTMVATGDGGCVIYVDPGKRKDDRQ